MSALVVQISGNSVIRRVLLADKKSPLVFGKLDINSTAEREL